MAKKKTAKKATKKATKKTAAKKTAKKPAKKKAKEMLLVGSKTKEALKGSGKNTFNVSADTLDALNEYVYFLVDQAQKKCAANGRKTIRPYDIMA
jgi:histone H3/H4